MDVAIRKAKDSLGQIFDKNLHDLVRGIRNHKENEAKYIAECIDEIKNELKQDNIAVKANAINKLCYLEMLGYDISWAAFNVIEVMSSTKFTFKRIGYLAASQSFHEGTDVLMLTTNMIRKDLGSQNMYEAGTALSGLSCFITPDLARDLANEIMTLMTNNKPYIRKKAVLIMYKIFLKYPDALRPSFPRLKEKLDDPDPSVQAAAVNVICELARKNPKNYLSLAPIFFKLMTVSTNNWVLIKIIKLFGALTPLEPRLGKKLIEPLTNLINSTSAMSLLYECINTVLAVLVSISSGQPNHNSAIQVCLQKLRILIEDSDQNLKYLGLLAMSKILQTNPQSVQAHKDLIMQCLDDKDESIRLRSLDLLYGMVTKKNLMEIIRKLMVHMNKAEGTHYRDELLAKIVDICSQNNYQYVTNFDWYVSILVELTRMEGTRHGKLLSSQMLDVAIRVESIRPFIVMQMAILIDNIHVFTSSSIANQSSKNSSDICEVLYAATWICGEFPMHLNDPIKTMEAMLKSKVTILPGHIQSAFIQNVFKLYSHIISRIYKNSNDAPEDSDEYILSPDGLEECKQMTKYVAEKIQQFEQSADIEVQERACTMLQILKYVQKMLDKAAVDVVNDNENSESVRVDLELASLFEGELNPVAPKAQRKVPIPEGLDLDEWINDPPSDEEPDETSIENQMFNKQQQQSEQNNRKFESFTSLSSANYGGSQHGDSYMNQTSGNLGAKKLVPELSEEDLAKYRESRKLQIESNPFYIKSPNVKKSESNNLLGGPVSSNPSINEIRSQSIDLKVPIIIPGVTSSDSYYRMTQIDLENKKLKKKMKNKLKNGEKSKSKKKNKNEEDEDDEDEMPVVKVLSNEMPEGAQDDSDDDEKSKRNINDPHRALDINLDEPLKDDEILPIPSHRSAKTLKETSPKQPTDLKKEEKVKSKSKSNKKENEKSKDETKKEKNKKEKVSKEKKSSKKQKSSTNDNIVDLLISTDLQTNRNENDYNELVSPDQESTATLNGNEKDHSTEKIQPIVKSQSDDLDFWLSGTATTTTISNQEQPSDTDTKETSSSKKKSKSKKSTEQTENEKSTSGKKNKEKSKKKQEKDDEEGDERNSNKKKSSKSSKSKDVLNEQLSDLTISRRENGSAPKSLYKNLASNKNLNLSYFIKPNPMNLNQIIINLKISNLKSQQIISSIELNILDTANIKLVRESGSYGDPIKLGYQLNQKTRENKSELYFNVTDCTFAQKLKGTLTYILKDEEDNQSAHEKIDFKLNVSCASYLLQTRCEGDEFSNLLSSGQLTSKYSIKFESSKYDSIESFVDLLQSNYSFNVVEIVDNNASLYSSSILNHPVCILVKLLNDRKTITIDGKSTNSTFIQDILEDMKSSFSS